MMFGYRDNWSLWQVALMWTGMIAFWAVVFWAIFLVVRSNGHRATNFKDDRGDNARSIIDERLARGEISPDEYKHLLDVLSSNPAPARMERPTEAPIGARPPS